MSWAGTSNSPSGPKEASSATQVLWQAGPSSVAQYLGWEMLLAQRIFLRK